MNSDSFLGDDDLDRLIAGGEDFIDEVSDQAGIDRELVRQASLSSDQVCALQSLLLNLSEFRGDEKRQLRAAVGKVLLASKRSRATNDSLHASIDQERRERKNGRISIAVVILIFASFVALIQFHGVSITVDATENSVIAIESTWWGLVKKQRDIRWMKPDGYDSPGWMTRDDSGKWYLYIWEEQGE